MCSRFGRHVAKTGDIRDFVIIEESGIAKGIRRIIAITGDEAKTATELAQHNEQEFKQIMTITNLKEREKKLKVFDTKLATLDISVVRKDGLREGLKTARKEIIDSSKGLEKEQGKKIVEEIDNYFKENPNELVFVKDFNFVNGNAKILQIGSSHAKSLSKAIYFFSQVEDEPKITHLNYLPKEFISKSFNAKTWSAKVSEVLGGKGGGKEDSAQGVGNQVGKIGEAIEVAKKAFDERS